jgi:hypothetical protein
LDLPGDWSPNWFSPPTVRPSSLAFKVNKETIEAVVLRLGLCLCRISEVIDLLTSGLSLERPIFPDLVVRDVRKGSGETLSTCFTNLILIGIENQGILCKTDTLGVPEPIVIKQFHPMGLKRD